MLPTPKISTVHPPKPRTLFTITSIQPPNPEIRNRRGYSTDIRSKDSIQISAFPTMSLSCLVWDHTLHLLILSL